ncbi:putative lipoprotein [Hyphomonas neptunium ATCC 15444]|uniref:Putative lipoprotein n=2 Tax=Hyphomonas TaxID=85 RepID=Q0BXK9_HYPNA|nr:MULTISPECIES: lipoprotein [Hyphomonas]ABI78526.1 putative lipoprotein [Hyphomonas neptunium ATCC 15444]KCZ89894.1 putative lipoprotein [Hyphomonas hirschiana VP5]
MKQIVMPLAAALLLTACASSGPNKGWTSSPGAQSFAVAHTACQQISYGGQVNYVICMAGRGWTKPKR